MSLVISVDREEGHLLQAIHSALGILLEMQNGVGMLDACFTAEISMASQTRDTAFRWPNVSRDRTC